VSSEETTYETIATEELAHLRRSEEAAKQLLPQMEGRRSATSMLSAVAALRAALKEEPRNERS